MALDQYVGNFTSNTSIGDQTISGVGFTPKLVLFWWDNHTTVNATSAEAGWGWGVANSSTSRWCMGGNIDDGASTVNSNRIMSTGACIGFGTRTTSPDGYGDFKEFNSDGFVITWDSAPGSAYIVHFMALGGTDIGSIATGVKTITGTGDQTVTGLGFQPDILHMASASLTTPEDDPMDKTTCIGSFGWATSATRTDQYAFGWKQDNGSSGGNPRMGWYDGVICRPDHVDATVKFEQLLHLKSFDAGGFTLGVTTQSRATDHYYLAIEFSGNAKAGYDTQKTSTGTKSNTDAGFEPAAALFFGANTTTAKSTSSTTGHDETRNAWSIGGTDGTNERAINAVSDNSATINSDKNNVNDKVLVHGDTNGTYSTDAEADLSSFDAGGFTLDWTTADASARNFGYMLFGESWAGPYVSATGSIKSATSGTTVTPVIPTHATNDIIFVEAMKNGASNLTCSGYTAVVTADNDTNLSSAWFWKRAASGSESNPVVTSSTTASASDSLVARVLVISGCVTTGDPFEDANTNGTPTSSTTPAGSSVTNTETLDLAMTSTLIDNNQTWSTGPPPAGWILEKDDLADPGAPVIESVAEWSTGGSASTTVGATEPTGVQVGDLLLIVGACEDLNVNAWGTLTGWTQLTKHGSNAQDVQVSSYWRIADGTETWPYTVTHSNSSEYAAGWTFRISGADGTTPIETQGSWVGEDTTGSSLAITGFTPGADNCLILAYAGTDGSDAVQTETWSGTGWPTSSDYKNEDPANSGSGVGIVAVTKTQTTAAATNTATVSLDVTDGVIGQQIAIQPASDFGDGRITTISKNLATATTTGAATVGTLSSAEYWRTLTLAWTSTAPAGGGVTETSVAQALTLGTTSHTVQGGATVVTVPQALTLGTTSHTVRASYLESTTAQALTMGPTAHTVIYGQTLTSVAQALTMGPTSHAEKFGATVVTVPQALTMGPTSHTVRVSYLESTTAQALTMGPTSHTAQFGQTHTSAAQALTMGPTSHSVHVSYLEQTVTQALTMGPTSHSEKFGATVVVTEQPLTLGPTVHVVNFGQTQATTPQDLTMGTTSHQQVVAQRSIAQALTMSTTSHAEKFGGTVVVTEQPLTLGPTIHTVSAGATVVVTEQPLTLGPTVHTVKFGQTLTTTPQALTMGTTSHSEKFGATVVTVPVELTMGTTIHNAIAGTTQVSIAQALTMGPTSHDYQVIELGAGRATTRLLRRGVG